MQPNQLDQILEQIAKVHNTTAEDVRKQMTMAMLEGQAIKDPRVQANWAKIPRKNDELTLEELVEYLAKKVDKSL